MPAPGPTFLHDADDQEEADRLHAEADAAAQRLVASLPPGTCPSAEWLSGALYAAATMHIAAAINGLSLRWPALGPFADEAERLMSWETLCIGIGPSEAVRLGERFRGLASVCDHLAGIGGGRRS